MEEMEEKSLKKIFVISAGDVGVGLAAFLVTTLICLAGAWAGYLTWAAKPSDADREVTFIAGLNKSDSTHYQQIADKGYEYHPELASLVAFFPAFPLLGKLLSLLSPLSIFEALLLISNLSLAGFFIVLAAYLRQRRKDIPTRREVWLTVFAFGMWPTCFFCHFAYTESLFLFLTGLSLLGMARNWPLLALALIVGCVSGIRPVGIALTIPFAIHIWGRSANVTEKIIHLATYGPLAVWGLAAYMAYLQGAFGQPLAFAQTQANYRMLPEIDGWEKAWRLFTLQPFFYVFQSSSRCYFMDRFFCPLFNLNLANPILFAGACILLWVGWAKKWLTLNEFLLGFGLLAIPYLTRAYDNCMVSMGRFTLVAFPIFIVGGRLISNLSWPWTVAWFLLCGVYLAVYSAFFVAGYGLL